jgi:hypothetical protein
MTTGTRGPDHYIRIEDLEKSVEVNATQGKEKNIDKFSQGCCLCRRLKYRVIELRYKSAIDSDRGCCELALHVP